MSAKILVKIYKTRDFEVLALQGLDLNVARGEFMAIIGNSGSGKSTLLNMLGGLDRPSAGRLLVDGQDLLKISGSSLVEYKRRTVGFVWQNQARNLVPLSERHSKCRNAADAEFEFQAPAASRRTPWTWLD